MMQPVRIVRNRSEPVDRFQVIGDRNSGTNYVTALIRANLPELQETDELGWKHGFFDRRQADALGLLTVVLYRHPVRWLQSVHRRPWEVSRRMQGLSFGEFIRATWEPAWVTTADDGTVTEHPIQGDMYPHTTRRFENILAMRRTKIAYLEELAGLPCQLAYVRYEDANHDPAGVLRAITGGIGLPPLRRLRPVTAYEGNRQPRYVPRRYPDPSAEDRAFIDGELERDLETAIGYRPWSLPRNDGLSALDPRVLAGYWRRFRGRG